MANEWYYTKGDQQIGPVSPSDLKAAAASGDLTPTSQVWKEGMAEWKPATKIRGLFDVVPGPTNTVPESPPPSSATAPIPDKAPKPSAMSSLLSTAKSAAQLAAKQAEKTKLTTITLPALYQPLGKHCYESQQHRAEFTDLFQKLDVVRSQLGTIATSTEGKHTPQSLSDKAKATAGKAMQAAQSQKLSMQQSSLFGALGKAVYEAHGENSGPSNLTGPIAASVARLAELDADISRLSSEGKGSWITPKRLAIAGAVVVCVSVLSLFSSHGSSRRTGDVLHALAGRGQVKVWNVKMDSELRVHYGTLGRYMAQFSPERPWTQADYKAVFGDPDNLRTVKEMIGYRRDIESNSQVWDIKCSDGRIVVRGGWGGMYGEGMMGPVLYFHFDKFVEGSCPAESELIKWVRSE